MESRFHLLELGRLCRRSSKCVLPPQTSRLFTHANQVRLNGSKVVHVAISCPLMVSDEPDQVPDELHSLLSGRKVN